MASEIRAKNTAKNRVDQPASFSFDSALLVKKLLAAAPERAREVLTRRFGLGTSSERETLESIGDRTSITRERVRQIEAAGLDSIRASKAFKESTAAFSEIARYIDALGAIVPKMRSSALGKDEKKPQSIPLFPDARCRLFPRARDEGFPCTLAR